MCPNVQDEHRDQGRPRRRQRREDADQQAPTKPNGSSSSRASTATPGRDGIGCVLVNRSFPGFEVTARYHTMGGEYLAEIQFNNVEVPLENVLLREGGFKKLLSAFNTQRCLNPSVSLGLAEGAFEEAIKYVRERQIRGQSVAAFQGIQWKLAEMYRDIEAGRSSAVPCLPQRRSLPRSARGRDRQDVCQRDGDPRRQRGAAGARRLRLHRRRGRSRASTAACATARWVAARPRR
jgi:alkylation response protein AidB-like acyl-CoA dehydrogenase